MADGKKAEGKNNMMNNFPTNANIFVRNIFTLIIALSTGCTECAH